MPQNVKKLQNAKKHPKFKNNSKHYPDKPNNEWVVCHTSVFDSSEVTTVQKFFRSVTCWQTQSHAIAGLLEGPRGHVHIHVQRMNSLVYTYARTRTHIGLRYFSAQTSDASFAQPNLRKP